MASTSIRNLVNHIAIVSYSNFISVAEKWEQPKNLANVTHFFYIIEKVIGTHIKPVHPVFLLNEDSSSQYYYVGTSIGSKNKSKLGCVNI